MKMNVDIKQTTPIKDENGTPVIFAEGSIIRRGSRFLMGTDTDPLIPIPVFYDIKSGKILLDMIPKEIRDEYQDIGFTIS